MEQYQYMAAAQNAVVYKRCNCKKAKCLKLYCVCFAAGEACQHKLHVCVGGCVSVVSNQEVCLPVQPAAAEVSDPAPFEANCRACKCVVWVLLLAGGLLGGGTIDLFLEVQEFQHPLQACPVAGLSL